MQCELNDRIIAAIQRLKDSALKYAGNAALQGAVDVQIWIQQAQGLVENGAKKIEPPKAEKK